MARTVRRISEGLSRLKPVERLRPARSYLAKAFTSNLAFRVIRAVVCVRACVRVCVVWWCTLCVYVMDGGDGAGDAKYAVGILQGSSILLIMSVLCGAGIIG